MDYLSYRTRASQKLHSAATARNNINHTTEQVVKNTFPTRRQSSYHMLSCSPSPDCTSVLVRDCLSVLPNSHWPHYTAEGTTYSCCGGSLRRGCECRGCIRPHGMIERSFERIWDWIGCQGVLFSERMLAGLFWYEGQLDAVGSVFWRTSCNLSDKSVCHILARRLQGIVYIKYIYISITKRVHPIAESGDKHHENTRTSRNTFITKRYQILW